MASEYPVQKRGRDEATGEGGDKKIRVQEEGSMEVRALVSNGEASVIIGKQGSNVQSIREKSHCFVSILKGDPEIKSSERVMSVKGTAPNVAQAFQLIADFIIQDRQRKEESSSEQPLQIKLLVHKFHTGALIGKGGQIIKQIIQDSGAKVQLSTDPLAGSTEKTVTITGTSSAIHQAVLRVLTQIHDNPLKGSPTKIPYVPGRGVYQLPSYEPPQAYYPPPPPRTGLEATQKIAIPVASAGAVIGKNGSIVADIKAQSGVQIRIAAPESSNPTERIVTITGSSQGIQHALSLIQQRVENPTAPYNFGGAPAPPVSYGHYGHYASY